MISTIDGNNLAVENTISPRGEKEKGATTSRTDNNNRKIIAGRRKRGKMKKKDDANTSQNCDKETPKKRNTDKGEDSSNGKRRIFKRKRNEPLALSPSPSPPNEIDTVYDVCDNGDKEMIQCNDVNDIYSFRDEDEKGPPKYVGNRSTQNATGGIIQDDLFDNKSDEEWKFGEDEGESEEESILLDSPGTCTNDNEDETISYYERYSSPVDDLYEPGIGQYVDVH